jgi:hypothetical protein
MNKVLHRYTLQLLLLVAAMANGFPAQAAYTYASVDYPGATLTQLFGSNDQGKFVGVAMVGSTQIAFVYDARTRAFTPLPNAPGALTTSATAINNAGVIAGSAANGNNEQGIILDKGAFAFFANPGWALTQARGISANSRLVTGYSTDNAGNYIGFIYDVEHNTFTNFLPSGLTIAEGINGRGDVVGNVTTSDSYGFVRHRDGTFVLFGVAGGQMVRGRGINDSGLITGFFTDANGIQTGFVARLASGPSFQSLSIPAGELLNVPGATSTAPETISNSGVVGGIWVDSVGNDHGFIATPARGAK